MDGKKSSEMVKTEAEIDAKIGAETVRTDAKFERVDAKMYAEADEMDAEMVKMDADMEKALPPFATADETSLSLDKRPITHHPTSIFSRPLQTLRFVSPTKLGLGRQHSLWNGRDSMRILIIRKCSRT